MGGLILSQYIEQRVSFNRSSIELGKELISHTHTHGTHGQTCETGGNSRPMDGITGYGNLKGEQTLVIVAFQISFSVEIYF